MAEKPSKPKPASLHSEFGWFMYGLIILAALWFFSGGLTRDTSHEGAFLKPPAPLDSGQIYGKYYAGSDGTGKTKLDLPEGPGDLIRTATKSIEGFLASSTQKNEPVEITSFLSKKIAFDGTAGAKKSEPSEEYLRIVTNEYTKTAITLSGLALKGNGLATYKTIPAAVEFLTLGVTALKTPVVLSANSRVLISSGRSPVGTSFRVNMCSGYLDQFQTYSPALRKECPDPRTELTRNSLDSDAACVDFVASLPRCRIYQGSFPETVSQKCRAFVTEKLNYNACALEHKKDVGFYENEWRMFLDSTRELWKNSGEIIRLLDEKGNTIDALSY